MNSDFCEFCLIFLKKQFEDLEVKFYGEFEFLEGPINVLYSKKIKKYILLMNLEKFQKLNSFEGIFHVFRKNFLCDENLKEIIFCLYTFKNKFILYNYEESEKIYSLKFRKVIFLF